MNFKTALILTFSPREKELPLPLSRWERRTQSASEGKRVGVGEDWGEGNLLLVSPIDSYF
jgi:hypothetical protein